MDKPLIEILGPWVLNRGDDLMLRSVLAHFAHRAVVAASSNLGLDRFPARPGLKKVKWPPYRPDLTAALTGGRLAEAARLVRDRAVLDAAPRRLLEAFGRYDGRETDLLLDASGYGYGDPWSVNRTRAREAYFRRFTQRGTPIVMVPQAFGPFREPEVREWCGKVFKQANVIFARDTDSLRNLEEIGVGPEKLGLAPDISHLLAVEPPPDAEAWSNRVAIVPNARMVDRTLDTAGVAYLGMVGRVVRSVRARGFEPIFIVHEDNDLPLVGRITDEPGCDIPVFHEDAMVSKSLIGASRAVVASRYHACVSALSQGVPTVGTSWSHKYERLFEEYGCADLIVGPDSPAETLEAALDAIIGDGSGALAARLRGTAEEQKERVRRMWTRVDEYLPGIPVTAGAEPLQRVGAT